MVRRNFKGVSIFVSFWLLFCATWLVHVVCVYIIHVYVT